MQIYIYKTLIISHKQKRPIWIILVKYGEALRHGGFSMRLDKPDFFVWMKSMVVISRNMHEYYYLSYSIQFSIVAIKLNMAEL
jgi:hypothetical protein